MKGLPLALALLLLGLCACGSVARPGASASPPPAASPLSVPDLQYRLVDTLGQPVYCDLSQGPVVRTEDPADLAGMVAALRTQNPAEFDAIVRHEHLNAGSLSPADDQRIVGQESVLAAVKLTPNGSAYAFAYELAGPPAVEVTGTIQPAGAIAVASRTPGPRRLCPL